MPKAAAARTIVVRQPAAKAPIIRVSAPVATRARRIGKAIVSRAASAAKDEKHRLYAVATAGLLGYAERRGLDIPHMTVLGTAGTYGLLGWAAMKAGIIRSRTASHVITGLLCVASYQFGAGKGVSGGDILGLGE